MNTLPSLRKWSHCPQQVVILGGDPFGLEMAQTLAHLGAEVTLLLNDERLLPYEDPDIAFYLQTMLEAQGIRIWVAPAIALDPSPSGIQVQVNGQKLMADLLLVAAGQIPYFAGLSPSALELRTTSSGLWVSGNLRTSHPAIYACGGVLGGYALPHFSQYEAELAVQNALFFPNRTVQYDGVPWTIATHPALVRLGLTEEQAKQRYGREAWVVRQPLYNSIKAQSSGQLSGQLKLIAHRDGTILGVHIVGLAAQDMIAAIALAMRQNLTLDVIAQLPHLSTTWSAILADAARQWQQQHRDRNNWQRELRETWFSFRRSWVR